MDYPSLKGDSGRDGVSSWFDGVAFDEIDDLRRSVVKGHPMIGVTVPSKDYSPGCLAQPRSGFDEGVQHHLQIECRAANDLQHVRRRLQLTAEPRNLLLREWHRMNCDGAQPLAKCDAQAPPSCDVAL